MTNLSRRHLVTTAAALPALTLPALASEATGQNHPDAELLRLGVELEALIVRWHAQVAAGRVRWNKFTAACEAAGLLPPLIDPDGLSFDELAAYRKKRNLLCDKSDDDGHGGSIGWSDINDEQFPLVEAIMAIKPHTLAGLAVIARAVSLHHAEQWDGTNSIDDEHYRAFMETVCAFAGVVPAPVS